MSLYTESKAYLLEKLKAAGLKSKPYTTIKGLEKSQESHVGAVIFEQETISRNGSKTLYRDQQGAQKKRRKVFNRNLTFTVTIGDYTDDAVEAMFEKFLASLDRGIYVNGDFVPVEVEGADWVNKDDSILKAQVAVQVAITFQGGLYRDTDFAPLSHVEITTIEKATERSLSMAEKKKAGAVALGQTEQPAASPGAEAPEVFTIEKLRSEKNVKRAVFAGVCAAEGWKPGKTVTEAEFLAAVERFTSAPMSGAIKKEAGK